MWMPPRFVDYVACVVIGWIAAGIAVGVAIAIFGGVKHSAQPGGVTLGDAIEAFEVIGLTLYFSMPMATPAALIGIPLAIWAIWQNHRPILSFALAGLAAGAVIMLFLGLAFGRLETMLTVNPESPLFWLFSIASVAGLLAGAAVGLNVRRVRRPMA